MLDLKTLEKMHQQRCGNPDVGDIEIQKRSKDVRRRNKRYVLEG